MITKPGTLQIGGSAKVVIPHTHFLMSDVPLKSKMLPFKVGQVPSPFNMREGVAGWRVSEDRNPAPTRLRGRHHRRGALAHSDLIPTGIFDKFLVSPSDQTRFRGSTGAHKKTLNPLGP